MLPAAVLLEIIMTLLTWLAAFSWKFITALWGYEILFWPNRLLCHSSCTIKIWLSVDFKIESWHCPFINRLEIKVWEAYCVRMKQNQRAASNLFLHFFCGNATLSTVRYTVRLSVANQ